MKFAAFFGLLLLTSLMAPPGATAAPIQEGTKVLNRVGTVELPYSGCAGRVKRIIPESHGRVAEVEFVLGPDGRPLPAPIVTNFNLDSLTGTDKSFPSARALLEDALFPGIRPVERWVDLKVLAQIFGRASRLVAAGLDAPAYRALIAGKSRELSDVRSELTQFVESTEILDVSQLPAEAVPPAAVRPLIEQILLEHVAKRIEEQACRPVRNSIHLLALLSTESAAERHSVYRPGIENPEATMVLLSFIYGALKGSVPCLAFRKTPREYHSYVSRLSLEQLYSASTRSLKQYYDVVRPSGRFVVVDADVFDHGPRRMQPFPGGRIPSDTVVYVWQLKKLPFGISVKMDGVAGDSSDVRKLWAARN